MYKDRQITGKSGFTKRRNTSRKCAISVPRNLDVDCSHTASLTEGFDSRSLARFLPWTGYLPPARGCMRDKSERLQVRVFRSKRTDFVQLHHVQCK
jgi:hypothetical protein